MSPAHSAMREPQAAVNGIQPVVSILISDEVTALTGEGRRDGHRYSPRIKSEGIGVGADPSRCRQPGVVT